MSIRIETHGGDPLHPIVPGKLECNQSTNGKEELEHNVEKLTTVLESSPTRTIKLDLISTEKSGKIKYVLNI